jgi:hypothetical protein
LNKRPVCETKTQIVVDYQIFGIIWVSREVSRAAMVDYLFRVLVGEVDWLGFDGRGGGKVLEVC